MYQSDEELSGEWRVRFLDHSDVEVVRADICQEECAVVVSPANSFGFMDGGLGYAFSEPFGWRLQKRLQHLIEARPMRGLLAGEAMVISTGDEKLPWLISVHHE